MQFLMAKRYIIIQARMTSSRLPGKVILPLAGTTVLETMLERLSPFKEEIIIATTDDDTQRPIVEIADRRHIRYFEGSRDDVLSRYYHAAQSQGARDEDIIVRLTSDCPLIDAQIVQKVIDFYIEHDYGFVSNCVRRTYPRGLDCEVFSFRSLKEAHENASTPHEKEHVTPYIQANNSRGSVEDDEDFSAYRLTLDEADDLKAIQAVYAHFDDQVDFDYSSLKRVLKERPDIHAMNAHIQQKTYKRRSER